MMRSISILCLWLILLILSTTVPASATEKLKLVVGGDHENPPYEFLENGKPTGFNVELMRAVAETIGAEVEFRLGPWGEVREELELGKIDALAGMYYSAQRSRIVDFSAPHTMVSAGLLVRRDSPIRSIDDIKDKEIIVQKGDVINDYLRENRVTTHIIVVTDPKDELSLLASGRHDCALMPSRFQGEYLKRSLGLSNIRVIGTNLPQFRYCFAVRKGNSALRYRLDEGLDILKVNGRYKEIYEKWFGIYEKSDLWRTVKYFVVALVLAAVLCLAFLIWSWMLKRRFEQRTVELRRSEENLRFTQYAIDKTIDQAFWMTKDAHLFYVNDATCCTLGYTREELVRLSIPDIDPTHPPEVFAEHWRYLQENGSAIFESYHRAKDGRVYPVEIRANYVVFDGKEYNCAFATDISERKRMEEDLRHAYDDLEKRVEERTAELEKTVGALQKEILEREKAEKALHHLNRTLRMLIKCREAMAHADDEAGLMGQICHIITEDGGYSFAWVGFAEKDEAKTVRPVAHAGYEDGYLESLGITWADTERGRGPVGTAIRESAPCLVKDIRDDPRFAPWREEAGKHGYISVLSIPFFAASHVIGALSIYASEPDAFDDEEVKLIEQLARDLSFGIRSLRTAAGRRRIEEALLKSEKNLAEAQAIAHLGSWAYDLEKNEVYWSDEFARIHGLDCQPTGLVFDSLLNYINPEDRKYIWEKVQATLQEGSPYDVEYRIVRSDGEERIVHARGKTIDGEDGRIIRFIGSTLDITERKRMEEELLLSHFCINKAGIGIHQITLEDGKILCVNDSACRSLGYSSEELCAMSVFDIDPSLTWEKFSEIKRTVEISGSMTFETVYRRKDGTTFPVEKTANIVEFHGVLTGFTFVRDITERKRAEEAILESRAKYQAIVDAFDGLIYISSQDYRVEFMNRSLIERTGYDAVGELCYKVIHDRDSICPWCVNDRVFEGETVHCEMLSPKDKRWYYVVNVPIRHADGSMSKHSMIIDINDRKLFEEQLQRQKQLLEKLNSTLEERVREEVMKNREKDIMLIQQNRQAALGEILDHIAHQWKQPLHIISLVTYQLKENRGQGSGEVREAADKILGLVDHMSQTLNVFRDFYRPDKGKSVFLIKESIDRAISFIMPALQFESVKVEVDVDPKLSALGYPKEFAQVILNLVSNARDAFKERKAEKSGLIIKGFAEDNMAVVTVMDNAGGICEATIANIFDLNFTTKELSGGTGVGLYMSKNIIERDMGGILTARNVDDGTQFSIRLGIADSRGNAGEWGKLRDIEKSIKLL